MTKITRRAALGTLAVGGVALALPKSAQAATHQVDIASHRFTPSRLSINVGDTVTWTNSDRAPHTATFSNGGHDTGRLNRGDSGSITFDRAGNYDYICEYHPSMRGSISVR